MLKFSGSSCLIGGPNESGTVSANEGFYTLFEERRKKPRSLRTFGESRVAAEASAVNNSVRQGARGFVHEIRCTREHGNSGTLRVRPASQPFFTGGGRGGEWCQQTLRQACSQEYPGSARCVQSFDDSLDSASRKTYRISLRSSSLWEPRHPSLKVLQR